MSRTKSVLERQNLGIMQSPSFNMYENVVIVSKRASRLFAENTKNMQAMIEELGSSYEDDENVFDQTRIALINKFEKKTKPIVEAMKECQEGALFYGYKQEEEQEIID